MSRHPQYGWNPVFVAFGCSVIAFLIASRFVRRAFYFVEHGIDVIAIAVGIIPAGPHQPREIVFEYQVKGTPVAFKIKDQFSKLTIGDCKEVLVSPDDPTQWVFKADFIDPKDSEI